jgi:5-formyltetrahydrofolate cyclo-ligase
MHVMKVSKNEIRERLKTERMDMPAERAAKASRDIVARCIKLINWERVQKLHTYVPATKENEVDSWQLLEYVWQNYPDVKTVVPVRNQDGGYDSVVVTPETKWHKRDVRIPRPIDGEVLPADERFDTVVVPMLGFDSRGYRLGHGKGWYDRFLATQPRALTYGLCYASGFVPGGLPHESHDVPIDVVVTEIGVREIN